MRFQSTLPSQGATNWESVHAHGTWNFNPRSPHRERPLQNLDIRIHYKISIHAPLTGSDYRSCSDWICSSYFNPRSPHRERLLIHWVMCLVRLFQSTLSSQGATQSGIRSVQIKEISIHAPLTGSDSAGFLPLLSSSNFNPRSPHRERPSCGNRWGAGANFNPRSPHRERPIYRRV